MPQFDPSSFASQIFWLLLAFVIFYWLMSRVAIPRIAEVLEARSDRITNDLERAEHLKKETDGVIKAYEAALSKARGEAAEVIGLTQQDIAALTADRQSAFLARLAKRVEEAEGQVATAKEEAKAQIRDVAVEAVAATMERLTGAKPPAAALRESVDTVLKESS